MTVPAVANILAGDPRIREWNRSGDGDRKLAEGTGSEVAEGCGSLDKGVGAFNGNPQPSGKHVVGEPAESRCVRIRHDRDHGVVLILAIPEGGNDPAVGREEGDQDAWVAGEVERRGR